MAEQQRKIKSVRSTSANLSKAAKKRLFIKNEISDAKADAIYENSKGKPNITLADCFKIVGSKANR